MSLVNKMVCVQLTCTHHYGYKEDRHHHLHVSFSGSYTSFHSKSGMRTSVANGIFSLLDIRSLFHEKLK